MTVLKEFPVISELVVVEGLHDKQAVDLAVSADVWIIGGDRIATRFLQELERAARARGVIVLTDPDGPGERIRRRIDDRIPNCKHAFLQKSEAIGEGRVGVEFASPESIRTALLSVRNSQRLLIQEQAFTLEDLRDAGLAGGIGSAQKRAQVGEQLRIGYANAKAFVRKLNVLRITRDEWNEALSRVGIGKGINNGS